MIKGRLSIKDNIFTTLLAISSEEQSRGLMFVEPPTPIMTFVYKNPQVNKFWMKNTPSKLDIVFCSNGKIQKICCGNPYSTSIIGDDSLSDLVVELPYGTCKKLGISVNDEVRLIDDIDYLQEIDLIKNKIAKKFNI